MPLTIKSNAIEIKNGATANLAADYVAFTSDFGTPTATAGAGELNVNAKWIDLAGNIAVSGVDKTNLTAELDIRTRGALPGVFRNVGHNGRCELNIAASLSRNEWSI